MKILTATICILLISAFAFADTQRFVGSCKAGPVMFDGECQPVSTVHVANGYDKAKDCALKQAQSNCYAAGYSSCLFYLEANQGLQSGFCRVDAYVLGK